MANIYAVNAGVILRFTFTDADDAPADPVSASFYVRNPVTRAITTYHLSDATEESTGVYTLEVVPDVAGDWYYRGVGTATLKCASLDAFFRVEPTQLT